MPITLLRESSFFNGFSRLPIYIDGEKIDTITSGEKKTIDVSRDGALLKVSHFGFNSNTLQVYKGDYIHLSVSPWSSWSLLLLLIFHPFLFYYSNSIHPWATILLLLGIYLLVFKYMKPYRLVKNPSRKKDTEVT